VVSGEQSRAPTTAMPDWFARIRLSVWRKNRRLLNKKTRTKPREFGIDLDVAIVSIEAAAHDV